MEKRTPERHESLHDPKLPCIRAEVWENRAQQRTCPAPIPKTDIP